MQRDFERLPLLRQFYHEAPDDVFELIVSICRDVNAFRLVNKRFKQIVESCTTKLTNLHQQRDLGPESLPVTLMSDAFDQRCRRIEEVRRGFWSWRLLISQTSPMTSPHWPLAQ